MKFFHVFFNQKIDNQDFPRFFLSVSQDPIQVHPGSLFIAFYPPCPFLFRTHFPTLSKLKWTWKIPSTSLEPSPRHLSLALAVPTQALGPGVLCNRNWMVSSGKNRGWGNVNYPITIKHHRRCSIFLPANMMLHKQKWGLNHKNRNPRAKWSKNGASTRCSNISSSTTINWGVVGSLSAR